MGIYVYVYIVGTHLDVMLELVGTLVVTRFGGLLAEEQRLLVQKDVPLLWLDAQPDVLLRLGPHLKRVLQQQLALLCQIGLRIGIHGH